MPGKDIVDGLVCVDTEEVIAAMVNASKECKTLLLIVDEENKIRTLYDDVILDGPPLPRVITPRKLPRSAEGIEEEDNGEAGEEEENADDREEGEQGDGTAPTEQGEETDSDFYESEYDVEDMDDDLFLENVDAEVCDYNEK